MDNSIQLQSLHINEKLLAIYDCYTSTEKRTLMIRAQAYNFYRLFN